MNDKERFHAIMGFEKPDRVLYWEQGFWGGTVERWYAEGMPRRHGVQEDPAHGDTVRGPATPIGPGARVCLDVLEEHGERLRVRDSMGIKKYITRRKDSIPHFGSWPVQNRDDFERLAAERLDPGSPERFPQNWTEQVKRLNACDGVVPDGLPGSAGGQGGCPPRTAF